MTVLLFAGLHKYPSTPTPPTSLAPAYAELAITRYWTGFNAFQEDKVLTAYEETRRDFYRPHTALKHQSDLGLSSLI